jgi:GNAT superfamily N-acetyltransferase/RimJ/RimL family protein N-acetyltransferase
MAAWLRGYNQAIAADLPDDPPWGPTLLRERLSITMPDERRLSWVAEADDGTPEGVSAESLLGYARLLTLSGLGVLELFVPPWARRRGVGRALLATVAERAVAEGFTSLGVEVPGGTPAAAFYEAAGFRLAFIETRSLLDLSVIDWTHLEEMASGVVSGYHIEFHPGDLPDEILPAYAEAKQVRRLDPAGDLELRPSSYDAERLRASLHCLQARGQRPYIVLAVHEPTGAVAGLTELVLPAQHPTRADQYDTVIVPAHNGYGLARAIKARMLVELRSAEPGLRDVQTWQAAENEQLLQVNEELGFKPDREWREYEADATDLTARLRAAGH